MQFQRRSVLFSSIAAAALVALSPRVTLTQNPATGGRRRPDGSEDAAEENPNAPKLPASSTKTMLEERQKNIKKDVEKLYDLASQLKAEVEKTDSTTILSLPMLRKAEEIEKLAKQIKDHAKG